ncbi:translation initiation factor IF-3 [Candidatus Dependentiae bacterium]
MKDKRENLPLINEKIRALKVQVINQDGENLGVLLKREALRIANEAELDLVLVSETGREGAPVTKIMDFGKVLYERKKKLVEAKKKQKIIQIKEVKFRPKIGEHDFQTKMNRAIDFLEAGKYLKITLMFRGRESFNKRELGEMLFERVENALKDQGIFDKLVREKDSRAGSFWSRIYYVRSIK